jgi:hypothetical protein
MAVHALDGDLPIPTSAHDLHDLCIINIGLVDLQGQRSLGMACVDSDNRQLPRF